MKSPVLIVLLVSCIVIGCAGSGETGAVVPTMTPADSYKLLGHDTSYVFLDVRTVGEFRSETGHLEGALLIPVDSLEQRIGELTPYRAKTIVTYCRTGPRSIRAEKLLTQRGFRAVSIAGGITRWNIEKLPVVREEQK